MARLSATVIVVGFIVAATIVFTAQSQSDLAVFLLTDRSLAPGQISQGLAAPAQAKLLPGGAGGGQDRFETELGLETGMAVADVAAHYAAQITAAGWRLDSRNTTGAGTLAAARFSGKSAKGDDATATLLVTALAGARKQVVLRLIRNTSLAAGASAGRNAATPPSAGRPGGGAGRAAGADVSSELMRVLLDGPLAGAKPQAVRAGSSPNFPMDLLPAGSVIAAVAESKSLTTVAAEAPRFAMADVPRFVAALGKLGWLGRPRLLGGFATGMTQTVELCRGTQSLALGFYGRDRPGVLIRAALSTLEGRACAGEPGLTRNPSGRASGWGLDVARPLLIGPPDATQRTGSSGGSGDTSNSQTRFRSKLPAVAIGAEYASQLTAAGWKVEGRVDDRVMVVTQFSQPGPNGDSLTALVSVVTLPASSDIDAWLYLVRSRSSNR